MLFVRDTEGRWLHECGGNDFDIAIGAARPLDEIGRQLRLLPHRDSCCAVLNLTELRLLARVLERQLRGIAGYAFPLEWQQADQATRELVFEWLGYNLVFLGREWALVEVEEFDPEYPSDPPKRWIAIQRVS